MSESGIGRRLAESRMDSARVDWDGEEPGGSSPLQSRRSTDSRSGRKLGVVVCC